MQVVDDTAPALFADNCALCHGPGGVGGPGFPSLVDDNWLWGGDPDAVMETIRVGINSTHPETRVSEMLAFGRDGILSGEEVRTVVAYVQSLSGGGSAPPETVAAGAELFAANCVACHGEDGSGSTELGAPNLGPGTGATAATRRPSTGPCTTAGADGCRAWEGRLSLTDQKILTVYLQTLGEENRQ